MNKLLLWSLLLICTQSYAGILDEQDKQKHILAETIITGASTLVLKDSEYPILYPLLIGAGIGLAKEVYDSRLGGSGFSKQDLLADSIGITIGLTVGSSFNIIYFNDFTGISFRTAF